MSTHLALRAIAQEILSHYNLTIRLLRFYAKEDHFLFLVYTPDTKYMLKLRKSDSQASQDDALLFSWLRHLQLTEQDTIFCCPISNRKGTDFTHVNGFVGVVYPWIMGRPLRQCLSLSNARKWGALMGALHQRSALFLVPAAKHRVWNQVYYWEPTVRAHKAYAALFPLRRKVIFERMEARAAQCLQNLYQKKPSPLLIHGDLHPSNVKVYQGRVWALDFDDFMLGYPIQDIAIALLYVRHQPHFIKIAAQFKAGYESYLPWPENPPHTLEYLWMARLLWMTNSRLLSEDLQDPESLLDLEETLDRYEEEFTKVLSL